MAVAPGGKIALSADSGDSRGSDGSVDIVSVIDDDSVAGPDRHFGGDCADGLFAKSIRTTSIDEPGQAIAAGGTGRPPPTAGRSSALGEEPDG